MVRNNKKGVVLPLVAVGIMAVAGLVPFLISNTETNNSVNISLDETNKQTWALQSAVEEKINNSKNSINPVLKTLTQNELPENEIKFNYGNDSSNPESMAGFEAKASVVEYNSYLNKNSCYYAHIHDAEGYDLSGINAVGVKPGVAIVNNTTYVWDKYGFLYEVKDNKLIKQDVKDNNGNNKRVWQVVSDGVNPVILTANDSLSAINTKNKSNYGDGYYEFVSKSDDFQAGIKQKDKANLAIPNNNSAANNFNADHPNVKVEDVSVSSNHGLALVSYKNDENKNVWEVWGWGNNSSDQLVCTNKDAKNEDKRDDYTQLTKISEIFSKCMASGNSGAVIDISPYRDIELSDNKDSISSYFHDYYKYTYKNGHYYVKDPKTGEETLHYTGSKSGKGNTTCNCAFCKDLGDAYIGKPSTELPVPLTINEDQALEQLELLVDGSGDSKIAKKHSDSKTLKCVIKSVDNPSFELSFEGGKVKDDEEVYTPYGDINIVVWDKNKLLDSKGNYYNLPKGKYQCEFYVSKKNGKWQALQAGDMFWGWIDRDSAGATQSMGETYLKQMFMVVFSD